MRLSGSVVKEQSHLPDESGDFEIVLHEQENIDVVGLRFVGHKRAENDESTHLSNPGRRGMDASQTKPYGSSLGSARAKSLKHLKEGCSMHPRREIATGRESRQTHAYPTAASTGANGRPMAFRYSRSKAASWLSRSE